MPSTVTLKDTANALRLLFDVDGVEVVVSYNASASRSGWHIEPTERPIESALNDLLPEFAAAVYKSFDYRPAFRSDALPRVTPERRIKYVETQFSYEGFRMLVRVSPMDWLALEHTGAILVAPSIIWQDGTKSFAKKWYLGSGTRADTPLRLSAGAYGDYPIISELDANGFTRYRD